MQPPAAADDAVATGPAPAHDHAATGLDDLQGATTSVPARLQALQAVTDAALTHLHRDALLHQVLDRITQVLRVDNTAILLLDERAGDLVLHVARGPEEEVYGLVRVPLGQGIAGRIAATGEPLILDDLALAAPINPFLRENLHSLMGVPLRTKNRIIGVLHVGTQAPHRFTTEDLQWLQLVGDRVALAIEHADLFEAERAARAQAGRQAGELAAIFEAIADPIMVYDREGRLVQANPAAHALNQRIDEAGYTDRQYEERVRLSLPRDSVGRPLEPSDLPTARVLRGERFIGAEAIDLLMRRLDGRDVLINISGAPIRDAQGQIQGAVVVSRDVTAQRDLERRTQQALDALVRMAQSLLQPAGERGAASEGQSERGVQQRLVALTREVLGCARVSLVTLDPETGVSHPLAVAGLSAEDERLWWDLPRQPAPDPDVLARFLAGEVTIVDMRQPPYCALPNPFGIRTLLAAPQRTEGGVIVNLSLDYGGEEHEYTSEEVTLARAAAQLATLVIERERLQREQAESRANELAVREVNRRMDEFLSIATHELRSPLTTVRGNLQLIRRRLQRALAQSEPTGGALNVLTGLQPLLQQADDQAARLGRMMADLLDVARIQSDQLELHTAPADLVGLVEQCVDEVRLAWPARRVTLDARDAAVQVQGDADRIRQVVINYLTNALKYSPPTAPVLVGVQATGGTARVDVRDSGPGLSPEQQQTIWERYKRVPDVPVQDDPHAAGGGLGLGLYISRMIIHQHGGAVGVESTVGQGTTFWFTLPCSC